MCCSTTYNTSVNIQLVHFNMLFVCLKRWLVINGKMRLQRVVGDNQCHYAEHRDSSNSSSLTSVANYQNFNLPTC